MISSGAEKYLCKSMASLLSRRGNWEHTWVLGPKYGADGRTEKSRRFVVWQKRGLGSRVPTAAIRMARRAQSTPLPTLRLLLWREGPRRSVCNMPAKLTDRSIYRERFGGTLVDVVGTTTAFRMTQSLKLAFRASLGKYHLNYR